MIKTTINSFINFLSAKSREISATCPKLSKTGREKKSQKFEQNNGREANFYIIFNFRKFSEKAKF